MSYLNTNQNQAKFKLSYQNSALEDVPNTPQITKEGGGAGIKLRALEGFLGQDVIGGIQNPENPARIPASNKKVDELLARIKGADKENDKKDTINNLIAMAEEIIHNDAEKDKVPLIKQIKTILLDHNPDDEGIIRTVRRIDRYVESQGK